MDVQTQRSILSELQAVFPNASKQILETEIQKTLESKRTNGNHFQKGDLLAEISERLLNVIESVVDASALTLHSDKNAEQFTNNSTLPELRKMFPDAHPMFLQELVDKFSKQEPNSTPLVLYNKIAASILDLPSYPKAKDKYPTGNVPINIDIKHAIPIKPDPKKQIVDLSEDNTSNSPMKSSMDAQLDSDIAAVVSVLPDIDPSYVKTELQNRKGDINRVQTLTNTLIETRTYPRINNKPEKKTQKKPAVDLDPSKILQQDFTKTESAVSSLYADHAIVYLSNLFDMLPKAIIQAALKLNNNHLYPAYLDLIQSSGKPKELRENPRASKRIKLMKKKRDPLPTPAGTDEQFEKEKFYLENIDQLKQQIEDEKIAKEIRFKEAEESGQLMECGCCFTDCLLEDMAQCEDGHLFCLDCCRRAAAEEIGKYKVKFMCLSSDNGGCKYEFPDAEVKRFLTPTVYESHLKRKQLEEIKAANIDGLTSCPFCDYSTIIANPNDRVFKCLNPECMKESCILCKEPSHIPLRCNEVEKDDETKMRIYIENKMTEALCRTCHKCKKHFFKVEGCNHMKCTCGAHTCYYCGAALSPNTYGQHFGNPPDKCPLQSDTIKLNDENVKQAAFNALQDYLKEHPEMKEKKLLYDPLKEYTQKHFANKNRKRKR